LKDRRQEGLAIMELANQSYLKGDPDKAETEMRDAVLILEKVGDRKDVARGYINLAAFTHAKGDKKKTIELYEKAKVISRKAGAIRYLGLAMMNRAGVLVELKRLDEALKEAEGALKIFEERGDKFLLSQTYLAYGLAHAEKEEWEEAEDLIHRGRLLVRKLGMPASEGVMLFEMGKVYIAKGDKERGLRHVNEAKAILEEHRSLKGLKVLREFLETLK
jgi:tetratricopeptide (TPR) repeat protein